jgi:prepilin-type N-terminal cleavage/methylation domain-containing protein
MTTMRSALFQSSLNTPSGSRALGTPHVAFTLIELLVVLVILSVLGSLSLAGLNTGRQRAKRDKTFSTIRKLDETIASMYLDRLTKGAPANEIPRLLTYEMPDQWADVPLEGSLSSLPQTARSAAVNRYARIAKDSATRSFLAQSLGPAECLWLCIARSGYEPDALEQFRPDELIDRDGDGAKEFCDGWGQPIYFLRWAPGFSPYSAVQSASDFNSAIASGDLLSQMSALTPLIYSAGPDGATVDVLTTDQPYGLQRPASARLTFMPDEFPTAGEPTSGSTAFRDNITNHDLMAR